MLEADDIDDDYFTPIPSTSLANIFSGPKTKANETENESLKYTPPKKQVLQDANANQNVESKQLEEAKATECVLACALTAYEWVDNKYAPRGKLGFAILKMTKTNTFNIVLYNSNKITLSNALVTTNLNITLKGSNYFSYYDNYNKYWSMYGNEEEITEILEVLKPLGICIKHISDTDQNIPEPASTGNENSSISIPDKESDTDSSVNRRTRASILNRMENMGHSVLPPKPLKDNVSESSDSDAIANHPPKLRPKPTKPVVKRISTEKSSSEVDLTENIKMPVANLEQPLCAPKTSSPTLLAMVNGQLVPVTNTSAIPMPVYGNNEMNLFMTEQRMNNNELRVNLNRTTDKVDQILEKLRFIERFDEDKGKNFQTEIMQKLLSEYEAKIKHYEQVLTLKTSDGAPTTESSRREDVHSYQKQISELKSMLVEKETEITILKETKENDSNKLVKEVIELKEELSSRTDNLDKLTEELSSLKLKLNTGQVFENKLKDIMNDVYHSVSVNFDSSKTYDGEFVKKVIGSIIKKATFGAINEYSLEK